MKHLLFSSIVAATALPFVALAAVATAPGYSASLQHLIASKQADRSYAIIKLSGAVNMKGRFKALCDGLGGANVRLPDRWTIGVPRPNYCAPGYMCTMELRFVSLIRSDKPRTQPHSADFYVTTPEALGYTRLSLKRIRLHGVLSTSYDKNAKDARRVNIDATIVCATKGK